MLGVLMEQTVYVSHCIKAILALYNDKMDSVVLIGHSMVRNANVYVQCSVAEKLIGIPFIGWRHSKRSSFTSSKYEHFICKYDNKLGYTAYSSLGSR